MIGQAIADGVLTGAILALGAIGVSLGLQIFDFANFAHSELVTAGAYLALTALGAAAFGAPLGPFSFGWPFLAGLGLAAVGTGILAILVDALVFRQLRRRGAAALTMVFASFGVALVLRNTILLLWGPNSRLYTDELQIAVEILPDIRILPDQVFVLALAALCLGLLHVFLRYSRFGKAMRAVAENPALARICGVRVGRVIVVAWFIAGALAAFAGAFLGLTVQLRPDMGFGLLLPILTVAILGGAGNLYGAVLGGLIVGLSESLGTLVIPASYKGAIPFGILLLVLYVRPRGLFGKPVGA